MQSNTHTLACLSSYFNLGFLRASTEIGERPFPFFEIGFGSVVLILKKSKVVKIIFRTFWVFLVLVVDNGCSVFMAARRPLARPPEKLAHGVEIVWVDRVYGYPVAMCRMPDGGRIEQIQFIDGIPGVWKAGLVVSYIALDCCTLGIAEVLIGTPIELAHGGYPTRVYYVFYGPDNKVIRAVSETSEEGRRISKMDWTVPFVPRLKVNRDRTVRDRRLADVPIVSVSRGGLMPGSSEHSVRRDLQEVDSLENLKQRLKDNHITEEEYEKELLKLLEDNK